MIKWLFSELIAVMLSAMRQNIMSSMTNTNNSDSNNKRNAAIIRDKNPSQQNDLRKKNNEVGFIELTVPFNRHISRTKAWKNVIKGLTLVTELNLMWRLGNSQVKSVIILVSRLLHIKKVVQFREDFWMPAM